MGAIKNLSETLEKMRGQRTYFDTAIFIYGLENSDRYSALALPFIKAAQDRQIIGITGIASLTEMLVHPIRSGRTAYAEQLKTLFMSGDVCECVSHSDEIFIASARLRVANNLKGIDALHFSTALAYGCRYFLTNDAAFMSTQTMEVVHLSSLKL